MIRVEVAYATAERQLIIPLQVAVGTTLYQAAIQSKIDKKFKDLVLEESQMGVFGKVEPFPQQRILEEGERVEIYRPLKIDPKEARKERAKKSKRAKLK